MRALHSTQELTDFLKSLGERLGGLVLPPGLETAARAIPGLVRTLSNIVRRLDEGPNAPLRLAFFGPTGAGKSKLFNSLLGGVLSPAGFRRPFTMRPVYSLHEAHAALAPRMQGEVRLRAGDSWRDVLFIDTPDFDSVERHNREEAERVFREAEVFLFITDVQKYADQSTWEYLERIFRERKQAIIVLNKVVGEGGERDFRARLEARTAGTFAAADLIVVREHAVDDVALLPDAEPGLAKIGDRIARVVGTSAERRAALMAALFADLDNLLDGWSTTRGSLEAYLEGIARLRVRLDERYSKGSALLGTDLEAPVDAGLKAEVYARVLERIQRIDILRYPRRLLALPLEGIKQLAGRWWPFRRGVPSASPEEAARDKELQALEKSLLHLAEETREDFQTEARCPGLLERQAALALRISHDELRVLHTRRSRAFREWLEREAREMASKLTKENKVKFILSQVIYNSIVVGVQIHTAGHFSLVELATDGVLSPLVAKAVGMAVSSERVGEFEKTARAEHDRLLAEVVGEARSRFASHLDSRGTWKGAFEAMEADMEALRRQREAVMKAFERAGESSAEPSRRRTGAAC